MRGQEIREAKNEGGKEWGGAAKMRHTRYMYLYTMYTN